MILKDLQKNNLIDPPEWLVTNTMYLTYMGSQAYGISTEESDFDVYGFTIPPKKIIFPHLAGHIPDFGKPPEKFQQFIRHHIDYKEKEYDLTVMSIVKYFALLMENNPNWVDSIFTPINCVIHTTQIGELVRSNRETFLHKGTFHKHKGYAFSQISKIKHKNHRGVADVIDFEKHHNIPHSTSLADIRQEIQSRSNENSLVDLSTRNVVEYQRLLESKKVPKTIIGKIIEYFAPGNFELGVFEHKHGKHKIKNINDEVVLRIRRPRTIDITNTELAIYHSMFEGMTKGSRRAEKVKIQGYDLKFAAHAVRLLSQCEQILTTGTLDLQEYGRVEHTKAIRRGEVLEEDIYKWCTSKEKDLERHYANSSLPHSPDEDKIKKLLIKCIEMQYQDVQDCIQIEEPSIRAMDEISSIIHKYERRKNND